MVLAHAALSASLVFLQVPAPRPPDTLPGEIREAYERIATAHLQDAIRAADRYTRRYPRDVRGWLLLGDAYAALTPGGRFRALQAYREAKRIAPRNPEPSYRMARLALMLGGDDGERIAREELEHMLSLNPLYRDAWTHWLVLYRNHGSRQRIIKHLQPLRSNPVIVARLAQLLVEAESYGAANGLLDSALQTDSTNAAWHALRAQSAFENGDLAVARAHYEAALRHAAHDSTGVLWQQVVGIASPSEIRQWSAGVAPPARARWIAQFWARRNPGLFAGANNRIAEHFVRWRYARTHYPLLHPLITYHRNARGRALNLEPSQGEREHHMRCEIFQALQPVDGERIPLPGVARAGERGRWAQSSLAHLTTEEKHALPDAVRAAYEASEPGSTLPTLFIPLGLDLRDVDTTAARVGYNLATGLDDRGLLYLRFGPPTRRMLGGDNAGDPQCNTTELERWHYPELGEVRFAKPSAFSKGLRTTPEMLFRPMNRDQFEAVRIGLTRDASGTPAPLDFGVWTAQFRASADPGATDVLIVSTVGEIAATLIGGGNEGTDRVHGPAGLVTLTQFAGRYELLAHARTNAKLGRQQLGITLRSFTQLPAMSDVLLASAWPADVRDRQDMIAHVQRTLTFSRGGAVRIFAELYGLGHRNGAVDYHATYQLLQTDDPLRDSARETWDRAVSFAFDRLRPATSGATELEFLDIAPEFISSGRYLLRLEVHDNTRSSYVGRASIAFEVW